MLVAPPRIKPALRLQVSSPLRTVTKHSFLCSYLMIHNVRSLRARTVPCPPFTLCPIPIHLQPKLTPSPTPRQNNSRLDELSSKISALRGVTIDIYDNARNQDVLDSSVCSTLPPLFLFPQSILPIFLRTSLQKSLQTYDPSHPQAKRKIVPRLTLFQTSTERSLLLHDNQHQRQRGPPGPDGAKRE